ncbi:MAG: hypothetical protein JEZ00_06835 [Anaerolineaceae bacterium]|nr:hypothetical protein [Anaerolineaceae bacterium]
MNILKIFKTIFQFTHAFVEENDVMSMYSEQRFPSNMYLHLPNAPLHPSEVEREKRRMVAENFNNALMLSLMKF